MLAAVQDNAQALTTTPRRPTGQFVPGISGNPGGKRKTPPDIKALAQNYTREMVETAVEIMRDDEQTGAARMQALGWLSDRAFGRAPITVDPEAANSLGASFVALLDRWPASTNHGLPPSS